MSATTEPKSKAVIRCPGCRAQFRIDPKFLNRTAGCTRCGRKFVAAPEDPGGSSAVTIPTGAAPISGGSSAGAQWGWDTLETAEDVDPRLNTTLGNFRLVGVVGRGGMGTVYEAEDLTLERRVAVKVLPPEIVARGKEGLDRFLREARSAGKLEHPNIVSIYQVGCEGGVYYIAMQLVRGGSASDFLREHGPMTPHDATRVVLESAKALAAAHRHGLIHRDIKPANILLGPDWTIKVADFGLAKTEGSDITSPGGVMGTPSYLSPEACRGDPVDFRSDLYSLGATYYCLLTGHPPFQGENTPAIMFKHVYEPIPDPRAERSGIPMECVNILMRALSKDVNERYQTAEEVIADLSALDFSSGPQYDDQIQDWAAHVAGSQSELSGESPLMETAVLTAGSTIAAPATGPTGRLIGRTVVRRGVRPWHLLVGAAAGALGLAVFVTLYLISSSGRADPIVEKKDDDTGKIPDKLPGLPPDIPPVGSAGGGEDLDPIPALPEVNPALVKEFRALADAAMEARTVTRDSEAFADTLRRMKALADRHKNSASVKTREYAANVEAYARELGSAVDLKDFGAATGKTDLAPASPWLAKHARDAEGFYTVFDGKDRGLLFGGKIRDWKTEGVTMVGEGRARPLMLNPLLSSRYFELRFAMRWAQADNGTRGGVGYWTAFRKDAGCRVSLTPAARWWEKDEDEAGRARSSAAVPVGEWVNVRIVVRYDKEQDGDVHQVFIKPDGALREAKIIETRTAPADSAGGGVQFFVHDGRLALRDIRFRPDGKPGSPFKLNK